MVKTKSGSNDFHGALFETARNNGMGLARRREDFYQKAPPLVRNEFGAYERYAQRQYSTFSISVIPQAMREGDFSGLVDGAGRPYAIYDSWSSAKNWSRVPYPKNQIPTSQRSPLATYMYQVTPLPTLPGVNPILGDNYFSPAPANRDDHTGTMRVDHRLSENDQLFVRYSQGVTESLTNNNNSSPPTLDKSTNYKLTGSANRLLAVSWMRLYSASLFSETLVTYTRDRRTNFTGDQNTNYAVKFGLSNLFNTNGFPELGNTGFGTDTTEKNNTFEDITRIWTIQHNMTKSVGRHEFEFGGQVRSNNLDLRPQEQYTHGSRYAAVARTGHNAANFFLGIPSVSRVTKNRPWFHFSGPEYAGYFQDNFKVNSRLTLNLGVRIESFPILQERDNILTSFDWNGKAIVIGQPLDKLYSAGTLNPGVVNAYTRLGVSFTTPEEAGMPHRMMSADLANWEPRFAFAWRVTTGPHPVVLRGGYSRFGNPIQLAGYQARARNNPPLSVRHEINPNSAAQSPDGINNYLLRNAPLYVVGKNMQSMLSAENPTLGGYGSVGDSYYDPYQPLTKVDQWNLTLERELFANTVGRVALLGNHTYSLDQVYSLNEAIPNYIWFLKTGLPLPQGERSGVARRPMNTLPYGNVEKQTRNGWGNFSGFQLEAEHRFSKGLAFQLFYVMSNARRAGGNDWRDNFMQDPYMFLDGAVPQDFKARNRLLNYHLDPEIPKHKIRWNWLVDLPFGRGKLIGRNAGSWLNRVWRNQYRRGPNNWNMDASLFKAVSITERVRLRFNADFFNVFNMPGMPNVNATSGIISMQNSVNAPRQLQLTLRLLW